VREDNPLMLKALSFPSEPKYSVLLYIRSSEITPEIIGDVHELLKNGIKIIFFTDSDVNFEHSEKYIHAKLLQIYVVQYSKVALQSKRMCIVDGKYNEDDEKQLRELSVCCPFFNFQQYQVEHAPHDVHLSIEAGAGTGKTTVMTQRIMFLLHTADIALKEMCMITFTREAAQNMFHKLREEFYERFLATKHVRYLRYIEELRQMRISTIDSFAKHLVQELGSVLGFGKEFSIRSFEMDRKQIIESYLNKMFIEKVENENPERLLLGIPLHRWVNIISNFWEQMEQKGFSVDDIRQMDWGSSDETSKVLNDMFQTLFCDCEDEFQLHKQRHNAVSLSDLTRQIHMITQKGGKLSHIHQRIKYLFVDEFQDTDDSQIRLIIELQTALNAFLFVVGDIKQSIYRFRGADYTAFQRLAEGMSISEQRLVTIQLVKNYRSSSLLLEKLDPYFRAWGEEKWLHYTEKDRLIGVKEPVDDMPLKIMSVKTKNYSEFMENKTVNLIKSAQDTLKDPQSERIAVLVRTNREAKIVHEWCERAGIFTQLDIGGTFFVCDAVNDFAALVGALLFPNDPTYRLNLLVTPYSQTQIDWPRLVFADGDRDRLLSLLDEPEYLPHKNWHEYLKALRLAPVLSVLRRIILETKPVDRYYCSQLAKLKQISPENRENQAEAQKRARQYEKNLNYLMELLHRQFSFDFVSLYGIHQWLLLNQATNRDEDEPELTEEEKGNRVRILTVHKSKGLEFHTVILPFTERQFRFNRTEILFEREANKDIIKVGWMIKENGIICENNFYNALTASENNEVLKEETRLLYVAMTRSKERLWIIRNDQYYNPYRKNWVYLLLSRKGASIR
jgi:ATP-dependent exoDNAse (exonuclease V) beta subunit